MKTTTNIIYPAFALFALACFALSPQARAVCQEGCDLSFGNTFLGNDALILKGGSDNTAIGDRALNSNTNGGQNTAIGSLALYLNTTGRLNTATGFAALQVNTTGENNTATGYFALGANTTGWSNTATGITALLSNTTANYNTAIGYSALQSNTTGSNNVALGFYAGANLTTGSYNIHIGNPGFAGESKRIRIGQQGLQNGTFIAGIRGITTQNANALPVLIDSAGQLGTVSSSRQFKKEIKPMDQSSEAILGLRPVTFHYKSDSEGTPQFGLIAEEVAEVNPALVVRDEHGEIYTVRYDAVNAMLLNEFLKEHRKNEKQETMIADLRAQIATLCATVKEQSSQIQKMGAQLELTKPATQTVLNSQ